MEVPRLNYIDGDIEQLCKVLTLTEIKKIKSQPRPEVGFTPRPKTPWQSDKAFFRRNPPVFEENIIKCFEFDWQCSKIEKWLENANGNARDNVYNYLRDNYKQM